MSIRSEIIRLLKEDEEFRYIVVGLLGLEDIRLSLKNLTDSVLRLSGEVSKLAEAQRRAEDRLSKVEDRLGKAEDRLGKAEDSLGKAEDRLGRLEEAVITLAEAQRRTEESLRALSIEVGKLSDTIGFGLEDIAKVVLPGWLYRNEGINLDSIERRFFKVNGEEIEVNLYGEGLKDGKKITLLGEAKSRIYKDDVKRFHERIDKLIGIFREEIYLLMFAYLIHPSAEAESKVRGIKLIASYMR